MSRTSTRACFTQFGSNSSKDSPAQLSGEPSMSHAISDDSAVRAANEAFYLALSAGSIERISAACAHDPDVTALHETSKEVAVGWPAVFDSWKAVPFESFAELSCVMADPAIKVHGTIARVAGLERVRGKLKT